MKISNNNIPFLSSGINESSSRSFDIGSSRHARHKHDKSIFKINILSQMTNDYRNKSLAASKGTDPTSNIYAIRETGLKTQEDDRMHAISRSQQLRNSIKNKRSSTQHMHKRNVFKKKFKIVSFLISNSYV